MAKPSFYCPDLKLDSQDHLLDDAESHHALKVRRLAIGDEVRLFNGQGLVAMGQIDNVSAKQASIHIHHQQQNMPATPSLTIASAIPKGDRQKIMIDMLTQLGVNELIPLDCERSVVRWQAKFKQKWQRYSIEACKQSQNPFLMAIQPAKSISEVLANKNTCLYLDKSGTQFSKQNFQDTAQLTLLVGPEGGFTQAEFDQLRKACRQGVKLSGHILRTEAAAISGAAVMASTRANTTYG